MNPDRWEVAKTIFGQAIELARARREQYLKEACGGDAALLQEVRSLLKADSPDTVIRSPLAAAPTAKRGGRSWAAAAIAVAVLALVAWVALRPHGDPDWAVVPGTLVRVSDPVYLRVRARRPGYLYLLSDDPRKDTMNALGTFPLAANVEARIPGGDGLRFDAPGGVDLWCIWSLETVPVLERLSSLFNARDRGRIGNYEQRVRLRQLVTAPPKGVRAWSVRLAAR
jgi:hypothetical protein